MTEALEVDMCVIGAGSGGLSVAAGAAQLGASTVLFERRKMGGDCLNYGCVPSKSLLASAKIAKLMRSTSAFGIASVEPTVDFASVTDHVRRVIDAIAPHDSVERFESLGVRVIQESAQFSGPNEIASQTCIVRARRIVIATGSSPAIPPIAGLDQVPFFTNETIFDNVVLPEHLIIIGGGPIGLEMAQAHRLLGAHVTVLEAMKPLAKDDEELAASLLQRLQADGIDIRAGIRIKRIQAQGAGVAIVLDGPEEETIAGSHLLVAAGRKPNLQGLALDKAGILSDEKGITVDRRLRTTNKRVYAVGDAAGGPQFTHVADYHAAIVIRNALFRLPAKVDYRALSWVTFTDPELAHVGVTEAAARQAGFEVTVLRARFDENDRAQTEGTTDGMIKVVARKNGAILGATILGAHAGELIQPWILAIGGKLRLKRLAQIIAPYPTLGEINKRVAGSFYTPRLFGPATQRLVRLLGRFG